MDDPNNPIRKDEEESIPNLSNEDNMIGIDTPPDAGDTQNDTPSNTSSNGGGNVPQDRVIDENTDAPEAGTPGHPGIDEDTA